jgi:predicted phosphoribosyltransferase
MTDRHALFSHYYWAIWCLNINEMQAACLQPPSNESWRAVMQQLQLSRQQLREVVDARRGLLTELQRVAAEWQKVLPTLALQLLQVCCVCDGVAGVDGHVFAWCVSSLVSRDAGKVLLQPLQGVFGADADLVYAHLCGSVGVACMTSAGLQRFLTGMLVHVLSAAQAV